MLSVMEGHPRISCLKFGLLLVLATFFLPGSFGFERGDRYWAGRPQPIGIDFSFNGAVAVYADGTDNFTTLGVALPGKGNEYAQYIYTLFTKRNVWDASLKVIDDDDTLPSDSWLQQMLRVWDILPKRLYIYGDYCFDYVYQEFRYIPQKPKSKYYNFLVQSRQENRLRNLMPKWFRTPHPPKPLTKSNFVMSLVELLDQLKNVSIQEHNITITSAIIARPEWALNEIGDLFDEACLLADIEVFEQPHSRVEIATKTVGPGGAVLVIDHGQYFMDIHRMQWDPTNGEFGGGGSMHLDYYGTMWILRGLANQIIGRYNSNMTESERNWPMAVPYMHAIRQASTARAQIKYGQDWPPYLDAANRTIGVNLTDDSGWVRVLNMTGQDVLDVEDQFVEEASLPIQHFLWNNSAIQQYRQGLPDYNEISQLPFQDQMDISAHIVQHVPPPSHIGSWLQHVEHLVVLSTPFDGELIQNAAEKALGWNTTRLDQRMCYPSHEIAARGAALRAIQWQGYYNNENGGEWMDADDRYEEGSESDGQPEDEL